MAERRVLLIVGGGIAAYKALELVRLLRRNGVAVRTILTRSGAEFVTPLSLAALSENEVRQDLFSLTDEQQMGHIELSRWADLVVVAPATAGLIARAASGAADDLASTALIATDKPVLMAPAMNVRMWLHPGVVRNVEQLRRDGVHFVGPDEGAMVCGEWGPGRLAEPEAILAAILTRLDAASDRRLAGVRALVTAGPTFEPIDPVRGLTNRSSGKQGYAVATALAALGAEVTLVSGPVALGSPPGIRRISVETALQMEAACRSALPADVAVCVAAVADWRPRAIAPHKTKKQAGGPPPPVEMVENPDILAGLSVHGSLRPRLVVGFAAETADVEAEALAKRVRKGCDWIVANDVSSGVFGEDTNAVLLVTADGVEPWPAAGKDEIGRRLASRIADALVSAAKDPV